MITYVNSKEAKLFELAAKDLGQQSLDIDQYLDKLGELKAISPKYVRLPLYEEGHEDEEIFEIDANARAIKIPASFSKNGVGVVSDELAEIVWFKINRYFDIKDFGKAAGHDLSTNLKDGDLHILIQWEAPDGTKGASWALYVDVDTDPEYVYFGWALTAEHLTAKAGNIRFAIRIMQYDSVGDKIVYSFSTQTAAVAVKASLDFDLTEEGVEFESVADKIASKLMDGQIAYCPVFAEDGDLPPYILNLAVPDGAPEGTSPRARLEVVAAAPQVLYTEEDLAKYKRLNGEDAEPEWQVGDVKEDSYDAMAYKWYKKGADDEDFAQIPGEYTPALTVTSSGQYYVIVSGMREIVDNKEYIFDGENVSEEPVKFKYHTSIASSKSTVCKIPVPEPVKITEDMLARLIIADEAALYVVIERQKIDDNTVGKISLEFEKTASAEKDLDLDAAEFLPVELIVVEGHEAYPERWVYDSEPYETEAAAKAAADADQGVEAGEGDYSGISYLPAEDAVPAHMTPISYELQDENGNVDENGSRIVINMSGAEEGYYKVTIINALNGDQKETESTVICRVVKPAKVDAAAAVLLTASGNPSDAIEGSVSRENKIRADVTINGLSDERIIQWYKVVDEQDPNPSGDAENDIKIEGANGEIYEPDDDGFFYFMATNKIEDTEDSKRSNIIKFAL